MEKQKKTLKEQNKLIAQGNSLVEGKYNYSLWELRLFIEMVQKIERDDTQFKEVRLYFKDLIKEYGKKSNDDYRLIQNAAIKLMRKIVRINYKSNEGEERVFHSPLVQGVSTPKRMDDGFDKYIELWFPEEVKPLLLDLKKNYLLYDKRNILNLKSKFSIRIYQLIKRHERKDNKISIVEYEVAELRAMLLVDDEGKPTNQYERYSQFEERVILIAQKELKEYTDISFRFDKIKKGRRIHSIRFYIQKNRKAKTTDQQPKAKANKTAPKEQPTTETPDLNNPVYQTEAFQKLIDKGITHKKAIELVTANEYSFILDTLEFCEQADKQGSVKNLPAFIVSSIKKKTFAKDIEQAKAKKAEQEKEIQAQRIKKKNQRQLQKLNKQFEALKIQKIEALSKLLTAEEENEILQIAKDESPFVRKKTDEEIKEGIFFQFAILKKYAGTERIPKKDADFVEWMKVNHEVPVVKNSVTNQYELVD